MTDSFFSLQSPTGSITIRPKTTLTTVKSSNRTHSTNPSEYISFHVENLTAFLRPRRTRVSSGSVIRIFRGKFVGSLGGTLSSQGLDRRLLVKEFTGNLALALARAELNSLGRLQSDLMRSEAEAGDWIQSAACRSVDLRRDNSNVAKLVESLANAPYLGILGTSH